MLQSDLPLSFCDALANSQGSLPKSTRPDPHNLDTGQVRASSAEGKSLTLLRPGLDRR
jgi:hypothetical protein